MRRTFVVVAIVSLLPGGYAFSQQATEEKTTTIERKDAGATEREASRYTTRSERLEAKPLDWNATVGERRAPAEAREEQAERAQPRTADGGAPNPRARSEAQKLYPEEWRAPREPGGAGPESMLFDPMGGGIRLVSGSPDVFAQYCENCPNVNTDAPESAIGKLFTNLGTCSASVVSGRDIIVTAAHCCYNRSARNWIGGWKFAPAYHKGAAPYGVFDWASATVLTSWVSNGNRASDVCLIKLAKDRKGHGVTYYTGWLGRSWNFPSDQVHHAVGYPGNLGSGSVLQLCTSESFSPNGSCGGAGVLNTGCSMTYGASGGPWIRSYRTSNWVNSVVSGYDSQSCTGTFGQTFNGPRFTSANIETLCNAAGC